jgi:hypothetical protein
MFNGCSAITFALCDYSISRSACRLAATSAPLPAWATFPPATSVCLRLVLPCASSNCFPSLPFLLLFISMNGFYLTIQKNAPTNEPSQQREKTTRQFHLVIFLLFWCVIVNHHQHNLTVHSIAK